MNTKPVERIVIRVYDVMIKFIEQLPLHPTQKMIFKGDNFNDYEYRMRTTIDLINFIQSQGPNMRVLSPEHLVDEIMQNLSETLKRYKRF